MRVDVAIIGAGPAGAMTALQLAGTGLKTALLEKKRVPRSKACGGAIPKACIEGLHQWLQPTVAAEAQRVRFGTGSRKFDIETMLERPISLVDRKRFDHQLIEAARRRAGGDSVFRDDWPVETIDAARSGLTVRGPRSDIIEADFIVGADGANSLTARLLGLHHRKAEGFAIDASVRTSQQTLAHFRDTIEFHCFAIPFGCGWIFPKGDRLSCGIGSLCKPFPSRGHMSRFLERSLPAGSIRSVQMRSHPIPIWNGFRRIASSRACLVGDAASLVNPITGEGIRYALKSGRLAAETILALAGRAGGRDGLPISADTEGDGCEIFERRIHQTIGRELEVLRLFALPVFLEAPELFYRKFILEGWDITATYRELADRVTPVAEKWRSFYSGGR